MAPLKKLTEEEIGLQQRPWITHDIIAAIKERNKLYKAFLEETNPDSKIDKHNRYKTKRNLLTSRLQKAKKDYYNDFFETNKNNVKRLGKV